MTEQNQNNNALPMSSDEEKIALLKAKKAEYDKEWSKKNEERLKSYRKEYNKKNKEKRKAKYERLKQEDPKYILEQNRLYRQKHPKKLKAQAKAYNDKTKEKRAQKYQENKEQERLKQKERYEKDKEKIIARSKAHYEKNKETMAADQKLKRQQNLEAARLKDRQIRERNKEAYNKREKEYFHKNKQECIKRNIEYRKQRAKTDPLFAAKEKLRRTVRSSFQRIKKNKPTDTRSCLGCTWEEAKAHLESLFQEGMTWENHGVNGWHIDHIRPVASFNENELHLMNLIENLQPLWSEDNLLKKDKYQP